MTAPGDSYASPLRLSRDDLDLSGLRAHCRSVHREAPRRSNLDLASWHARQHHRLHLSHYHRGPFTLITTPRNPRGIGQIIRPLGNYTGQEMVTRAELAAGLRARRQDSRP